MSLFHTIQVDGPTYNRLLRERATMERALHADPQRYPADMRGRRLSMGRFLTHVLDGRRKHRLRRERAKRNRAGKGQPVPGTMGTPPGDDGREEGGSFGGTAGVAPPSPEPPLV